VILTAWVVFASLTFASSSASANEQASDIVFSPAASLVAANDGQSLFIAVSGEGETHWNVGIFVIG